MDNGELLTGLLRVDLPLPFENPTGVRGLTQGKITLFSHRTYASDL
jgi:hypothetical protein